MGFGGGIASLFVEIGAETSGAESGFQRVASGMQGLAGKASGLAGYAATGFGMAIAGPILGTVGGLFSSVTDGVMGTNSALQDSGVAWGVLLGGADQAQQKLAQLYNFGATTPFNFEEVDKSSRMLQQFGGNALNTMDTLTMVGNAASGTGYRFQDVSFWTGRLYDSLMNGQPFGDAAMNLQQMGVISGATRTQLEGLQKEGAKGPELWAAYTASQQKFGGMMQAQSVTFSGMLSTLKDTINQLLATAGKPIFDLMTSGLTKLVALLSSDGAMNGVKHFAEGIASGLSTAASAIGAFIPKVQAIGTILGSVFQGFKTGDFSSIFGPILDGLNKLHDGLGTQLVGVVNGALNMFQVLRDGAITFFQALSGDWGGQFDTRINGAVKAAGNFGLTIREVAQWVTGTAIPALVNFGQQAVQGFQAALPHIQQFGQFLITAVQQALPAIQQFVTGTLPQIAAGFQAVLPHVQQFATFLGQTFQTAIPIIQQFAAGVLPLLQAGFAQVSAVFQQIAPYVTQFVATLQTGLAAIIPAVQQFGGLLMTAIGGAIQQIVPLALQLWASFQSQLPAILGLGQQLSTLFGDWQGFMAALAPVGQLLAEVIGGVIVAAIGLMLGAVGGLIGMLSGALPGAIQAASGIITVMQGTIALFTDVVSGMVSIVSNLLHGDWAGAWQSAQDLVQSVSADIQTIVQGMWATLEGLFTAAIGAVEGYVTGFSSTIGGYFQALYTKITGDTTTFGTMIQTAWTNLTTTVSNTVSGWVTSIGTFFSNLGTSVQTATTTLGTNIETAWTNLTTAVTTTVSGWVTTIGTFFSNMGTQVTTAVQTMKGNILSEFDNLVSMVKLAMSTFSSTVINAITGLAGSVGGEAAAVGTAIVNGIAGAISSGAGAIADAAKGAAQSALDAAKGLLGIHSPSTVFAEVGQYMMQGWANGISAYAALGVAAVAAAMKQAADMGDTVAAKVNVGGLAAKAGDTRAAFDRSGGTPQAITVVQHIAGSVIAESEVKDLAMKAYYDAGRQGRL